MRGRYVSTSVDPQQCIVGEREVELYVGWMVHHQVEPPEESRWDRLALLGSNVHLAAVDGSASNPLLCRGRKKKTKKKPQTGFHS